jgi:phosphoheptose isomerase
MTTTVPPPDNDLQSQHRESIAVLTALADHHDRLLAIAGRLSSCLERGGTIYLCGNGGSAADAQHVAAEFVGRFLRERRPLPAVALTCNTSLLTAIGNDYDFSEIFARQVRAHAGPRDCVVGISTSGGSVPPAPDSRNSAMPACWRPRRARPASRRPTCWRGI